MKKLAAVLLTATAITAQAQTFNDAQVMARCSAEFIMSASLMGESSPYFKTLVGAAQQSSAISRTFYRKIGQDAGESNAETKSWLATLNRQYSRDPQYVKGYLIEQTKNCNQENTKLQRFAQ